MSRGRTGQAPPSQGAWETEAPRRHQAPTLPLPTTWESDGDASVGVFVAE